MVYSNGQMMLLCVYYLISYTQIQFFQAYLLIAQAHHIPSDILLFL